MHRPRRSPSRGWTLGPPPRAAVNVGAGPPGPGEWERRAERRQGLGEGGLGVPTSRAGGPRVCSSSGRSLTWEPARGPPSNYGRSPPAPPRPANSSTASWRERLNTGVGHLPADSWLYFSGPIPARTPWPTRLPWATRRRTIRGGRVWAGLFNVLDFIQFIFLPTQSYKGSCKRRPRNQLGMASVRAPRRSAPRGARAQPSLPPAAASLASPPRERVLRVTGAPATRWRFPSQDGGRCGFTGALRDAPTTHLSATQGGLPA